MSGYHQKRQLSPTPSGPSKKQVKIAPRFNNSTSTLSQSLNTADLGQQLAKIKFDCSIDGSHRSYGDSGIECSNEDISQDDLRSSKVIPGIPKPKMYQSNGRKTPAILRRQRPMSTIPVPTKRRSPRLAPKSKNSRKSNPGQLVSDDNMSFPVIRSVTPETSMRPVTPETNQSVQHLLDEIELNMESPMKGLLSTPPKRTLRMTSTPIDSQPLLEDMISPIKGFTPLGASNFLDSGIFTPIHDKSYQFESTPDKMCTSLDKSSGSLRDLGFPSHNLETTPDKLAPTCNRSPLPGSLRDLGLPGLTPMKELAFDLGSGFTPPKASVNSGFTPTKMGINSGFTPTKSNLGLSLTPNKSPLGLNSGLTPYKSPSSVGDQSFTKLLGDFHLESFMDEPGIDINDISLSMLQ